MLTEHSLGAHKRGQLLTLHFVEKNVLWWCPALSHEKQLPCSCHWNASYSLKCKGLCWSEVSGKKASRAATSEAYGWQNRSLAALPALTRR